MMHRALILAALLAAVLASPAAASSGAQYLASRQTSSGGFAEPGGPAAVTLTEWAVMGLKAAGKHPGRMHRNGGHTAAHYLAKKAHGWSNTYSIERGLLAAVAMGKNPENFGDRNLVRALRKKIHGNGRIGKYASSTYWGVLALRAAGSKIPRSSVDYIRGRQLSNGGFSYATGAGADSNDTAAAVMALRAARVPCGWNVIGRAYDYMHSLQHSDHGYGLTSSSGSDSQSTGWVIAARIKCHLSNTGALSYLHDRRHSNGSYSYRKGVVQTPAWVTSQVLPAVNGRSYPVH